MTDDGWDEIQRGVLWLHVGWAMAFVAFGFWAHLQVTAIDNLVDRAVMPEMTAHTSGTISCDCRVVP